MGTEKNNFCRVCGFLSDMQTGDICSCCNVQRGYEDSNPEAARAYRQEWLGRISPENRNLEDQLKNIPEEYK